MDQSQLQGPPGVTAVNKRYRKTNGLPLKIDAMGVGCWVLVVGCLLFVGWRVWKNDVPFKHKHLFWGYVTFFGGIFLNSKFGEGWTAKFHPFPTSSPLPHREVRNPISAKNPTFAVENSAQPRSSGIQKKQEDCFESRCFQFHEVSIHKKAEKNSVPQSAAVFFQVLYPTIDSISELFPLLCVPIAAMRGKLMYRCNLGSFGNFMVLGDQIDVTRDSTSIIFKSRLQGNSPAQNPLSSFKDLLIQQ